jgi:glycosyltransferase involved in cell wall biosynthesis
MEAMATGVPVVSTRLVGIPELVEDNVHGFIVPPRDDARFADKSGWLLDHPEEARRAGANSRERVRASLSASQSAQKLANLISRESIL